MRGRLEADAPCGCGSGRSYARCCRPRQRAAKLGWALLEGGAGARAAEMIATPWASTSLPAHIRRLSTWEADILPVPSTPGRLTLDPEAPAMALVAAGSYVLHLSLITRLPRSSSEAARILETLVLRAADDVGHFPDELRLRRPALSRQLSAALARWQVRCVSQPALAGIDSVMQTVRHRLSESPPEVDPT